MWTAVQQASSEAVWGRKGQATFARDDLKELDDARMIHVRQNLDFSDRRNRKLQPQVS